MPRVERTTEARDQRLRRVLLSMRSMDSSRPTDHPPPGGTTTANNNSNNNRRARPRSPTAAFDADCDYDPRTRHRQRQRQSDASTQEIIQFVRGYQLEREPTLLRLQKKAPLPGIGQMSSSIEEPGSCGHNEEHHRSFNNNTNSRYYTVQANEEDNNDDDDAEDNDEEDDDNDADESDEGVDEDSLLDNEVAAIDAAASSQSRDQFRQISVYHDFRYASVPPPAAVGSSKGFDIYNSKPIPSYLGGGPSTAAPPSSQQLRHAGVRHGHPADGMVAGAVGRIGPRTQARRNGLGRSLKQLPPIARDELPERPSAPSPSLTPPGEGEELDSAGEPIDFIDAS